MNSLTVNDMDSDIYSDPAPCLVWQQSAVSRSTLFTFHTPILIFVVSANVIFMKSVNSKDQWFKRERSSFVDPFAPPLPPYLFSIENFDSSIYKSEGIVVLLKFDLVFVLFLRVLLVKFSWHEFAARYMFDLTTESVPPIRMISKIFSSPRPLCWNCGYKFTSIWINRYKIQWRLRTPIQLNDDQESPLFLYELIFDDFWCPFHQYLSIYNSYRLTVPIPVFKLREHVS